VPTPHTLKAVIPVAGLGTRFLPATKALPKEMLPVVDKPVIQYVVEEAVNSGLTDILMITGRNKNALENHFDRNFELEVKLEEKGDEMRLERVTRSTDLADIHYVRQGDPKGLGHAVLKARAHVGQQPFALLLGDDIIDAAEDLLIRMLALNATTGSCVVALMEVPEDELSAYGVVRVEPTDSADVVRVTELVEKPAAGEAPSNLAIVGRYVLAPEIFDILEHQAPGRGGEIQLTDALQTLAAQSDSPGILGIVYRGSRHDTGDRLAYLKAVVEMALERGDLGPAFGAWLDDFVDARRGRG
jgi:UTP--glucose-1-phosphate uridylyltransferase